MGHMCSARVQRPCPKSAGGQVERRYVRHRPEETALYDVVEREKQLSEFRTFSGGFRLINGRRSVGKFYISHLREMRLLPSR